MGALYFLVRLLTSSDTNGSACRHLARSLLFAGAGVTANFALLSVYLALWIIGLAIGVARRARDTDPIQQVRPQLSRERRGRQWLWLSVTAVVFTALVLSQDANLSSTLYEPVSVRIVGLFDHELDAIAVNRSDTTARWRPLSQRGTLGARNVHSRSLDCNWSCRARSGSQSGTYRGDNRFDSVSRHERRAAGLWRARDVGRSRVMESEPGLSLSRATVPAMRGAINWAGDKRQVMCVAAGVGTVLLGLCILARALAAARWALDRYHLLGRRTGSVLSRGILWIAVVVAAPGYVLTSGRQLLFGGHEGLVRDTYTSLIINSFHGATYHPWQTALVLAAIAASVAAFAVVAAVYGRRSRSALLAVAVMMQSLFLIVSAIILLQHALLGTPFLVGRTALFHIPLYLTVPRVRVRGGCCATPVGTRGRCPHARGSRVARRDSFRVDRKHHVCLRRPARSRHTADDLRPAPGHCRLSRRKDRARGSASIRIILTRVRCSMRSVTRPRPSTSSSRRRSSRSTTCMSNLAAPGTEGRVVARYARTGSVLLKATPESRGRRPSTQIAYRGQTNTLALRSRCDSSQQDGERGRQSNPTNWRYPG